MNNTSTQWSLFRKVKKAGRFINTTRFLLKETKYFLQLKLSLNYSPKDQDNSMLDDAGDTRTYPCISWCNAEQKSVQ